MIFPKTTRVSLSFTHEISQSKFQAAKVIIVDKRNTQSQPQIFTLSPESMIDTEDLQALKNHFLSSFCDGVFIPMGTLFSIDRKKKTVKLTDDQSLSYEYLVVVTNLKNHQNRDNVHELYCGLNALIDALRIKKNNTFANQLQTSRKLPPALEPKQVQILHESNAISKPETKLSQNSSDWFFESDVLLYEVQT